MRRLSSLVLILTLLRLGFAQTGAQSISIPPLTEVEIELLDNLSSETMRDGQSVAFKVVKPVVVNGATIIDAGLPVFGEVRSVQSAGAWHKAGCFDLVLKPVRLEDGLTVTLDFQRPKLLGTRKEKTGEVIGTSMMLTYYFPLIPVALIGGAKKGKPYQIRAGERYLVHVVSSERASASSESSEPSVSEHPKAKPSPQ